MSPIAALYDVHGNLPALEAVLAEVEAADAETIVVGGDVVPGPMAREALDRLQALGPRARFLRGNTDRLVVAAMDGAALLALPPAVRESMTWTAARLDRAQRDVLAALPTSLALDVPGLGPVRFCHATPRSDEEILTAATPDDLVRPMLAGVAERVVVCGRTHLRLDRTVGDVRVVNAGSLGMPFDVTGAHWLLLDERGVHARTTAYDLERAAALVRATTYPDAESFAARYVLAAPGAEASIAMLETRRAGTRN